MKKSKLILSRCFLFLYASGSRLFLSGIFAFCILNFIGCAMLKEGGKLVAGTSTQSLERGREDATIKTFNYDYFACYTKTLDILTRTEAYIYVQDVKERMIALYISETDTTPVGVFFKEIDTANTQVEVYSPSTYAKEQICEKIFSGLEKK